MQRSIQLIQMGCILLCFSPIISSAYNNARFNGPNSGLIWVQDNNIFLEDSTPSREEPYHNITNNQFQYDNFTDERTSVLASLMNKSTSTQIAQFIIARNYSVIDITRALHLLPEEYVPLAVANTYASEKPLAQSGVRHFLNDLSPKERIRILDTILKQLTLNFPTETISLELTNRSEIQNYFEICNNTIDDDVDGLIDSEDTEDCPLTEEELTLTQEEAEEEAADEAEQEPTEEESVTVVDICNNTIDDDVDGLIDSEDIEDCPPPVEGFPPRAAPFLPEPAAPGQFTPPGQRPGGAAALTPTKPPTPGQFTPPSQSFAGHLGPPVGAAPGGGGGAAPGGGGGAAPGGGGGAAPGPFRPPGLLPSTIFDPTIDFVVMLADTLKSAPASQIKLISLSDYPADSIEALLSTLAREPPELNELLRNLPQTEIKKVMEKISFPVCAQITSKLSSDTNSKINCGA